MAGIGITEKQTRIISSDEDAYAFLDEFNHEQLKTEHIDIQFDDWPKLKIRLRGDKFHGTMTTQSMRGFIELQANIYRSYALLKYGDSNTNRLTSEEREELEIVVSLEEGCSVLEAALSDAISNFAQELTSMESHHKLIAVVAAGLIWAGTVSYKAYLESRRQIRLAEIDAQKNVELREVRVEELNHMTFMSGEETKRLDILTSAIAQFPAARQIQTFSQNTNAEILKSTSRADSAEIQGVELKAGEISELKTNARKTSLEDVITGNFKVDFVNSSKEEYFTIKLTRINDGLAINATLINDQTPQSEEIASLIQDAEWTLGAAIECDLRVTRSGDKITKAIIERAAVPARAI